MTAIDIATLRKHIGTRIVDEDVATAAPLRGHRRHLRPQGSRAA